MYLDVRGLVTTGVGNLIDPVSLALALPWLKADGTPATQEEIQADWKRVKAMQPGQFWTHYQAPNNLYLSDEAIDALVLAQLDKNANVLVGYFPDFASLPGGAQRAILSIAWAVGAGFPPKWPNFSAAVRAHDWVSAANNSSISAANNPGIKPRNEANKAALLAAASGGDVVFSAPPRPVTASGPSASFSPVASSETPPASFLPVKPPSASPSLAPSGLPLLPAVLVAGGAGFFIYALVHTFGKRRSY